MISVRIFPNLLFVMMTCALMLAACDSDDVVEVAEETRSYATEFTTVKITLPASASLQLSVHACAGLYNRQLGGSVFVQTAKEVGTINLDGASLEDEIWLDELGLKASKEVESTAFVNQCVTEFGGCVRYEYDTQHEILPAILTSAAALEVVPLASEDAIACDNTVLDAMQVFADKKTQYLSTKYVYENFLDQTTGLAMLNPGYDREADDKSAPKLIDDMPAVLIDYVFSHKIFTVFLVNGCITEHPERDLLSKIVNESNWEKPVGVLGYNDSWLEGGYLWEAQTRCLDSANMGAIPTRTTNLSFFATRRDPITVAGELETNEPEDITYDADKTYVAFVIGDGDNIRYIMSSRRDWLQQRLDACAGADKNCPPLTWSISPHLPYIAPDVLEWYYKSSRTTGSDYFILPPSGHQYAYPSSLNNDDQANFVERTAEDARILSTQSVVHWEWFSSWRNAENIFLPRYADNGVIKGAFTINVPYLFEAFPSWPETRSYILLEGQNGGAVAVFKPRSWRGVNGKDDFHKTPQQMADTLGGFPEGTVTWMYMTSDGGLTLDNSYMELIKILPAHVQLVSTDAAAKLAIAAGSD